MNFSGSTQQKVAESSVSKLAQNGYQAGNLPISVLSQMVPLWRPTQTNKSQSGCVKSH